MNPEEEIVMNKIITIPMDENTKFTIKDYREMLYKDMIWFNMFYKGLLFVCSTCVLPSKTHVKRS